MIGRDRCRAGRRQLLTLGGGIWHAFTDSMDFTQTVVLEQGGSLLAAAWIVPLLSRSIAGIITIPLGLIVMLALYAFVLRGAELDRANVTIGAPGIAHA